MKEPTYELTEYRCNNPECNNIFTVTTPPRPENCPACGWMDISLA